MINVQNVSKTFILHQQNGVRLPVLNRASLTVNAGDFTHFRYGVNQRLYANRTGFIPGCLGVAGRRTGNGSSGCQDHNMRQTRVAERESTYRQ